MQFSLYLSGIGHICAGYMFFTTDPDVFLSVAGQHWVPTNWRDWFEKAHQTHEVDTSVLDIIRNSLIHDGIQLDESDNKKQQIREFGQHLKKKASDVHHQIWLTEEDEKMIYMREPPMLQLLCYYCIFDNREKLSAMYHLMLPPPLCKNVLTFIRDKTLIYEHFNCPRSPIRVPCGFRYPIQYCDSLGLCDHVKSKVVSIPGFPQC